MYRYWLVKSRQLPPDEVVGITEKIMDRKVTDKEKKFINELAGKTAGI